MKTYKPTLTIIVSAMAVLLCVNSCVVNRPDLNGISDKDYNKRQKVSGAHYTKRISVPGIILTAAAPVAGAIVGYNVNMVTVQQGADTKPVKPANAAIGAVVGYSLANFINYAVWGLNKQTPAYNPADWTRSINDKYAVVPNSVESNGEFYVIDKSVENDYIVKNFDDTRQFYALFPNSRNAGSVFLQSINICDRDQLSELINLDRQNTYVNEAKKRYINLSPTYEELADAQRRFPEIDAEYENMFAELVRTASNATDFHRRFPNSTKNRKVVWLAFSSAMPSKSDIAALRNAFGSDFELNKGDLKYNPNETQKSNFMRSMYEASNIKNETDLELFYRKYDWVTYNGKGEDVVTNVFTTAYNTFDNGNYLLYYLRQLPSDPLYKGWGVSSNIVDAVVEKQLKKESDKVKIVSTQSLGQNHSDWEKWMNNTVYTAGVVAEKGEVKYIVYGEIENTSKFDMPVVINASADLIADATLKGKGGIIGQLIGAFVQAASGSRVLASCQNEFIIPSLPARSKSSYAVMMSFENGGNAGVNVGDWFKIAIESRMGNLNITRSVERKPLSGSVQNTQEQWLSLAKNGMPGVILTDLNRNERVDQEVWAQRWEVEKRRRAEAAAQYEAERRQRELDERYEEALQNEINNRKADVEFSKSYEVWFPTDQVSEYHVTFGDGKNGCIGVIHRTGGWYYHTRWNPDSGVGRGFWTYGGKSQSEAVDRLYEALH